MDVTLSLTHVQSFTTLPLLEAVSASRKSHATITSHIVVDNQQTLIAGTSCGDILIWKSRRSSASSLTSLQTQILSGHQGRIHALLCVDSKYLFSASSDRNVRVWAPWEPDSSRARVQTLIGHSGTVTCLGWCGLSLVTGSTDRTLRVWRHEGHRHLLLHPVLVCVQTLGPFNHWITSLDVRPSTDPPSLFAADGNGTIHVFSVGASGLRQVRKQHLHSRSISKVFLVPHENLLISLSYDCTLQVHDANTGTGLFAVENPNRCRYTGVAWDGPRKDLVVVDALGYFQIWNIFAERCLKVQRLRRGELSGVVCHHDAVVVSAPECIEIWNVTRASHSRDHSAHTSVVVGLVRGVDGLLWSASVDNTIRAWNDTMSCVTTLRDDVSEISAFGQIPETNLLITGLDNGDVHVWNSDTGSALTLYGHTNAVTSIIVARSHRRELLVTGSFDARVLIWDVTRRKTSTIVPALEHELVRHPDAKEVLCVAHNVSNGMVLAGGNDGVVQIWDLETYEGRGLLVGHRDAVIGLAFDGNLVLTASNDGDIRIWDAINRQCLDILESKPPVRSLVFAEGLVIASYGDGNVQLWDYVKRAVKLAWRIPNDAEPRSMLVESGQVIIGSENGTITVFNIPDGDRDSDDVDSFKLDVEGLLPGISDDRQYTVLHNLASL